MICIVDNTWLNVLMHCDTVSALFPCPHGNHSYAYSHCAVTSSHLSSSKNLHLLLHALLPCFCFAKATMLCLSSLMASNGLSGRAKPYLFTSSAFPCSPAFHTCGLCHYIFWAVWPHVKYRTEFKHIRLVNYFRKTVITGLYTVQRVVTNRNLRSQHT